MEEGDVLKGTFTICSSIGEYRLPYEIQVEQPKVKAMGESIDSLEAFAALAKKEFQRAYQLFVTPEFAQMLEALNAAYCKEHRRRPHFTKITMQDKLVLTLLYRREYRSMENIAAEYGVSRDTIADNIHWVERALLNANLLQNSVTCVYKTN